MTRQNIIIEERRLDEIHAWMPTGKGTDLPEILQGIYFMDGNNLPDDCLTLNAKWEGKNLTLLLPVLNPLQWTFHSSDEGRRLLDTIRRIDLIYEIRFKDNSLRRADILPIIFGLRLPQWILAFEMNQKEDSIDGGTWERKNFIFFRLIPRGGYTLRKVVDKDGQKLPAFKDMLAKVPEKCIVVADTNPQASQSLPTRG